MTEQTQKPNQQQIIIRLWLDGREQPISKDDIHEIMNELQKKADEKKIWSEWDYEN